MLLSKFTRQRPSRALVDTREGVHVIRTVAVRTKVTLALLVVAMVAAFGGQTATAQTPTSGEANLAAIKQYVVDQAAIQKTATEQLVRFAGRYAVLAEGAGYDYQAMWDANTPETAGLLAAVKAEWINAHNAYEMNEGLIAGIPSLSYYDVWIDAGPSEADDPAEALDWTVTLSDGTTLVKPGNIFHSLTEPIIWGTVDEYVALKVDLDADGTLELGEVLPEAKIFLATAQALDEATAQMQTAVNEWEPTIEDAFSALVTMLPTMTEYFEQWKLSSFVSGESSTETGFVAGSRLVDVNGIVNGLALTYSQISPLVAEADAELNTQIEAGFTELVTFVTDLYQQELDGKQFTAEEAELFGTEAQAKATALTGQISQVIALLGIQV